RRESTRESSPGPWDARDRWSWRNPEPRHTAQADDWEEQWETWEERGRDDRASESSYVYEDETSEPSPVRKSKKTRRPPPPPASKRSRSTQVSDEFIRRQQEGEPLHAVPKEAPSSTQRDRLAKVVDLLEVLARASLPTLLNSFWRSGDFTKHHNTFHTHPSTKDYPRVGNWNLSLTGSMLCPPLRSIYRDPSAFGSFMEAFVVCHAQMSPQPTWFPDLELLVTLVTTMTDTCSPATYEALTWRSSPAEFIHVFKTYEEQAPEPGEAGTGALRNLLDTPVAAREQRTGTGEPRPATPSAPEPNELPAQEDVPETPPPAQLQQVAQQKTEPAVDSPTSSQADACQPARHQEGKVDTPSQRSEHSDPPDDEPMRSPKDRTSDEANTTHRLIGGHRVRPPPSPPSRSGSSPVDESGTEHWMRKHGKPSRVRGERAKEISKALTQLLRHAAPRLKIPIQEDGYMEMGALLRAPRFWNQWITEAEVIDVIHYNQKSRFEVCFQQGIYLVRALQGHSISHIRDDLVLTPLSVDQTPEYAAHGTFYDFYGSILQHGLMAGGRHGPTFRRHIQLVEWLPWQGAVSGMRSDCDIATWIRTREAAAAGVRFYRSANDVLRTETTLDPALFHSVQIMRSTEVLTADGGPPHPQQVALAISRAPTRDTQRSEQYMAAECEPACAVTLPKDTPHGSQTTPSKDQDPIYTPVYCHNVGGLGSGMYEDLMGVMLLIRRSLTQAGHYRPIGLQDQLGKLTFKALVEPHQNHIYSLIMQFPQYGYTPGRSHRDALRRVFDHCSSVRANCRALHSTLHDRFAGTAAKTMTGGLQITLDLAGAFDAMPRHRLLEGMQRMQLPAHLIHIVMSWHQQAHYHINHDGTDRVIHALRRQLNKETSDPSPNPDVFRRGPESHAWQRVMDTLQLEGSTQLTEIMDPPQKEYPNIDAESFFPPKQIQTHMHSENAAFRLQDRSWLQQYCALCSQWIACSGKMKQHYRDRMDQLQEVFGPLVTEQLNNMDWQPVKREAEPNSAPADRSKASRTELGKGRPWQLAPTNKQPWRKGGGKGRFSEGPNLNYLIKALARLALQQETALKILRQDYSWVLFVQPGNQGPLPLLFAEMEEDIGGATPTPFQTKAEESKWLQDGCWCYQKWSPALGSLVEDENRPPLAHTKLVEALQLVLPLIMQPYMVHRFHATRPLAGNMTGITTFQLDVSNRTKGHMTVWECLEALTGLAALQVIVIGLQLRRDSLKQSPAAALVQQALAEYS
ncbi:TRPT1, partial [Symbiodinium sp. CCMP2592]